MDIIKIGERQLGQNNIFLGDRSVLFPAVKEAVKNFFENMDVFQKKEVLFFEIEKLNISVDDIRRMIHFANRTSEGKKVVMLSSFYWADEAQNAMLKVLEETPTNTAIFLFGLSEKNFLSTILSRIQKTSFKNTNRYLELGQEVLKLPPNERLENKNVKKILSMKVSDYNFEKNIESEKKDREAHILFLYALIGIIINAPGLTGVVTPDRPGAGGHKKFLEQILQITTLAEIEGGSPHLFIEWLLLATPQIMV